MKLINIEEHYQSKQALTNPLSITDNSNIINALDEHILYMNEKGIDVQILSYASSFPSTSTTEDASKLCRKINDEMALAMKKYPGRFYAFAHLPLNNPNEAANELERCVKELGFVGAMLSGHFQNLPYDDEHYFPIYQKAQECNVPIYLHPSLVDHQITDHYYKGAWDASTTSLLSGFGIGWHYDVGMQAIRMMLAGVFDQFPNLKIILGHWGEVVSFYMYRLDEMLDYGATSNKKISDYFKQNIYVNPSGMLYKEQFRYCLDTFGADHILWGEDYPYRQKENIRSFLEEYELSDEERTKIASGNAEKLFNIKMKERV